MAYRDSLRRRPSCDTARRLQLADRCFPLRCRRSGPHRANAAPIGPHSRSRRASNRSAGRIDPRRWTPMVRMLSGCSPSLHVRGSLVAFRGKAASLSDRSSCGGPESERLLLRKERYLPPEALRRSADRSIRSRRCRWDWGAVERTTKSEPFAHPSRRRGVELL